MRGVTIFGVYVCPDALGSIVVFGSFFAGIITATAILERRMMRR